MRSEPMKALFAKRGDMARVARAVNLKLCTVSNWEYIPARHIKAVSKLLGIPQRDLPRKESSQ